MNFVRFCVVAILLARCLVAQNPVPTITNPVQPQAVAPGSPAFSLSVRGTNFVPGAVVTWNRSPRTTNFISSDELQAQILASDVSSATAGFISVTNPGGPTSSASYGMVEVGLPHSTVTVGSAQNVNGGAIQTWAIDVEDVNGDGILDLVETNNSAELVTLLGRGDGTFKYSSLNPTASGGTGLAYGDFNSDGKVDVADAYDGIFPFLGNGDGTFTKLGEFGSWYREFGLMMAVGDFNRDGALDIAVADQNTGLQLLLGQGDGTFHAQTTSFFSGDLVDVTAADINGDGMLDLVTYGLNLQNVAEVNLWIGNGDGTFQNPVTVAAFNYSVFSRHLFIDDFNNDGHYDLLVGVTGGVDILLGNGNGTFGTPVFYSSTYSAGSLLGLAVGDFTSDGNTDVVLANVNTFKFGILRGNGDGTLQPIQGIKRHGQYSAINGISTGDFNSDGKLDFVFSGSGEAFTQQ